MTIAKKKEALPKKGIIGMDFSEFERLTREGGQSDNGLLSLRKARLIPSYKTGDELHLASVTLAAIKYVKEFREQLYSIIGFKKQGSHHFYTEVAFNERGALGKCRFDGLILQVIKGKIRDAVFFEFKGKNAPIEPEQIEGYLSFIRANFGKECKKMVTVSSEFVADPSHVPFDISKRSLGQTKLYHLSWSHLKTIAHLLLFDNEDNIEDVDQIALMREILDYYEDDKIALTNYGSMSRGWSNVATAIREKTVPLKEDLEDCAKSWIEEQTDMAHSLSKHLGVMVKTSSVKGDVSLSKRLSSEVSQLKKLKTLDFDLNIKASYSDINVEADFETNCVTMSVTSTPPLTSDKKGRARLKWMLNQLVRCQKVAGEGFDKIQSDLFVETRQKYFSSSLRTGVSTFSDVGEQLDLSKDIVEFKVLMQRDLKKKFSSGKGFVTEIERMLLDFYSVVVQNLKSWTPPQPRITRDENS